MGLHKVCYSKMSQFSSENSHPRMENDWDNWTDILLTQHGCIEISYSNIDMRWNLTYFSSLWQRKNAHKMLLYLPVKYMENSNSYGGNWVGKVSHKTGKLVFTAIERQEWILTQSYSRFMARNRKKSEYYKRCRIEDDEKIWTTESYFITHCMVHNVQHQIKKILSWRNSLVHNCKGS